MISGLLGKKVGMTQVFDKEGDIVPVTVVETGPCFILGLQDAPLKVRIGFDLVKESRASKPRLGLFKKVGVQPLRIIKEFRSSDNKDYKLGQEIKVDLFKPGEYVDVTGISIGKGFQGGMKRWNWSGGPETHGSMHHRRVGSIGSSSEPSRIWKGHHMPGHMGAATVTVQSLRVMQVDSEHNLLVLKGAVPGHRHSYLSINKSRKKAFRSLDESKRGNVRSSKKNPMKESKAKAKGK
ncbi:MAG: 50S ribosomal protein L3 [Candidatus Omnitrophota bacterium]